MNRDTMWEAMAHLEPDLIEEADQRQRRRMSVGKVLVIAAAACLVLAAGVLAAESIFGFRILELQNDGEINHYRLLAEETAKFPISQFGETVQDYIQNGMPILEEGPAESGGAGEVEVSVITFDVPTFSTWEETAEFVGADIPLGEENPVLAGGSHRDFSVHANRNAVVISTVYSIGAGCSILFNASVAVEGAESYETGAFLGNGDLTITPQETVTGSGTDVLLYVTTGERSSCDAYFIQDGILYNLFMTSGDTELMEEILAAF